MIRYAAHFVYLPDYGFLKQYVVEMRDGHVIALFPLTSEIENTEWQPGVIVLTASEHEVDASLFRVKTLLKGVPSEVKNKLSQWIPVLLFPFDFTGMKPVAETQRIRLR